MPVSYKGSQAPPHMLYSGFDENTDLDRGVKAGPSAEDLAAVEALSRGELVGRDGAGIGELREDVGRKLGWREIEKTRRREG
jgi:hypothetical protein